MTKPKITYATLSADNEELQSAFDEAIETVKSTWLGKEFPMWINGQEVYTEEKLEDFSPLDTDLKLGVFQSGNRQHSKDAIAAAKAAFPGWKATPWQERVALIRKAAEILSNRSLELSAVMILEVGKSRLEALGEVEEAADLLRYYADSMEQNNGFIKELGKLNPDDPKEHNYSYLQPYGVWVVIAPFNFPMALSAAPIAAALVTGNTVVYKGALETPYSDSLVSQTFIEAGVPAGVFNAVLGPDETTGQELLDNPDVDGWTFTGSHEVGMKVLRNAHSEPYPKPAIIEMGGKNPTIVSNTADLERAATGVYRAAFGMDGQKCSACSRVYVHEDVYDEFKQKLLDKTAAIKIGDPTERDTFMGTVSHQEAYEKFKKCTAMARKDGKILYGGNTLTEGAFAKGYYVEPTVVEGLPEDHFLVQNELFVPILVISKVSNNEEAMDKANNTAYGLTAGFFGEEVDWFFNHIQAGTTYANRTASATTGAWPGVQVFGGWKGSGSSGKGIGGPYTLVLYMREHSRTIID